MLEHPARVALGRRPRAVSFVASLVLAEAVAALVVAGLGMAGLVSLELRGPTLMVERVLEDPMMRTVSTVAAGGLLAGLLAGLLFGVAGLGLLRIQTWAWSLAVVTHGVILTDALAGYAVGRPPYAMMALGSVVVLVLNQREVRHAFVPPHAET